MAKRIKRQIPLNLFPCKNCLLVVYRKYYNHNLKLMKSTALHDALWILEKGKIIKKQIVEKMTPG